jgi:small subunit ribosomal protein S8
MKLTDPVADMLARIRNAIGARHQKVDIPASKLKLEIARILKEEGFISNFKGTEEEGHKLIRIYLKYDNNNEAAISNVARVSRPGCRVYVRRSENQHIDHATRRHDRTGGAPAGSGRRGPLRSLVETSCLKCRESEKNPLRCPRE